MRNTQPLISFTFDDFPLTALTEGGRILNQYRVAGTYYASLGLMGGEVPAGNVFKEDDLRRLLDQGHELGCHTFDHLNAWETDAQVFETSVTKNQETLKRLLPQAQFDSLSYPICVPRPETKRRVGSRFQCCRCGGQKINEGTVDASNLSAFFLEKCVDDFNRIKALIDSNCRANGWLIFATHDVRSGHSAYGCSTGFFEKTVQYSVASGAVVLPVVKAWERVSHGG
jgi:peptidoglycan/xylan/chitin deacetylase (PgdA/CDA1 family)